MKILKIIGIVVAVIIAAGLIWVMTLSEEAHLERTVTVNAPIEKVYAAVNDFSQTKHWSPWMKIDPNMITTYSDNTVGAGAYYSWTSDHPDVGNGRQDILESIENERVVTKMEFGEGGTGSFTADFILESNDDGTKLTWTFDGKVSAIGDKMFMAFTDFILGPMYDQGIADLKIYIEGLPDPEPEMEEEIMEGDSTIVEEMTTEE